MSSRTYKLSTKDFPGFCSDIYYAGFRIKSYELSTDIVIAEEQELVDLEDTYMKESRKHPKIGDIRIGPSRDYLVSVLHTESLDSIPVLSSEDGWRIRDDTHLYFGLRHPEVIDKFSETLDDICQRYSKDHKTF